MSDRLLTTRELVDVLQLDRVTIYKMLKDGTLPALRLGGQWRFSAEAIDGWLKAQVPYGDYPRSRTAAVAWPARCPSSVRGSALSANREIGLELRPIAAAVLPNVVLRTCAVFESWEQSIQT